MAPKLEGLSKTPVTHKILLAIVLSAVVAAGYYYVYYVPKEAELEVLDRELKGLQARRDQEKIKTQNLEQFRKEVQELELKLTLLLEQLPSSAEIPSLLKNISDLGKESGLDFLKFSPGGEVPRGFYAEIPVSIIVSGDYHSFVHFADQVSKYPRIVNLLNISFSGPRPGRGGVVRSTVSCTATTYRFLDKK